MPDWGNMATTFASNIIGGVLGYFSNKENNRQAAEREAIARAENYKYGEMSANNADARSRALYKDLQSPLAMLKQYKEAGLSPSLMFGKGGAGGQSIPAGAMAPSSAVQPTVFGYSPMEAAQIGLMQSETRKNNAEADTVKPQAEADIARKLSEAGLNNAAKKYTEANTQLKEIEVEIADTNKTLTIEMFAHKTAIAAYNARQACAEAIKAENEAEISTVTMQDAITRFKEENKNLIADTLLKYAQKELTEQQRNESETRIWTMIEQLNIEWTNALANEKHAQAYTEWIDAKMPYIEKELELESERIGVEKTKVWVEGTTNVIRTASDMIFMKAAFGKGKGDLSPTPQELNLPKVKPMKPTERKFHQEKLKRFSTYSN